MLLAFKQEDFLVMSFYRPHPKDRTVCLSVCLSVYIAGGTPSPSHNTSNHWSHVSSGVPKGLVRCPFSEVTPRLGCPLVRTRVPPRQNRDNLPSPPTRVILGYSLARTEVTPPPPSPGWYASCVLSQEDSLQSVNEN